MNTPQSRTEFWTLFAAILASSMAFIDSTALNVAIPALQADFQASGETVLWILNAYLLMLASFILIGGSAGDKLGRKKVFITGIWIFIGSSLACGLAPSAEWLVAARVVQGLGGALMVPGSLSILTSVFPPERRGKAIGVWSMFATIVTVIGPVLGGLLADAGLWRGVFLINLPLGLIALVALYVHVPESRDDTASTNLDYPGALLAAAGLASLTYGFIAMPSLGPVNPRVLGTLAIGTALLVSFVIWEQHSSDPMMPLHLFRSKTFSGTNLLTLFLYGALGVGMFFLSLNMVQLQGYLPSMAGLAMLPFA
ncbi:MAG: MFS transporter, partial [Bacteroidetes bacterium]|nr:MFS transporter [Bacteroidota bacterium]